MPSLRSVLVTVAATLAAAAQAQYSIDPNSVPISTRRSWCNDEKTVCPMICLQMGSRTTLNNDCDPETLTYECLCGNNQRPNISEYSLTMPYYLCQEWGNQCVKKCNDNACASNCREQHPCGATDPKQYNITSSTSGTSDPTASQTGSGVIFTNSPGGSSANNSRGAGSTLAVGHTLSLPFLVSSLFAIFALLC